MCELNNTAMSRTLQKDECVKLLNIFAGGIHMSKAMNPVPIYHKITLTIFVSGKKEIGKAQGV